VIHCDWFLHAFFRADFAFFLLSLF